MKYKNRTYEIYHDVHGKFYQAEWRGYRAQGKTKTEACENCHQMIEEDYTESMEDILTKI